MNKWDVLYTNMYVLLAVSGFYSQLEGDWVRKMSNIPVALKVAVKYGFTGFYRFYRMYHCRFPFPGCVCDVF